MIESQEFLRQSIDTLWPSFEAKMCFLNISESSHQVRDPPSADPRGDQGVRGQDAPQGGRVREGPHWLFWGVQELWRVRIPKKNHLPQIPRFVRTRLHLMLTFLTICCSVLANMLMKSGINPFDSQEAKPYKNDVEILAMTNLVNAYQNNDIKDFEKILKVCINVVWFNHDDT